MKLISIRDLLSFPIKNKEWFYLPPEQGNWTLDTKGIFSLDASDFPSDSDDYLPIQAKKNGWVEVLDGATIEDIIENTKEQLTAPSLEDLFKAFIYYYKNDAFFEFSKEVS